MASTITVARPYARAVFELANETGQLAAWGELLAIGAAALADKGVAALLDSPALTADQRGEILLQLYNDTGNVHLANFLRLLAQNDRLDALPQIAERYEELRAAAEGTVDVELVSVEPVSEAGQERLAHVLRDRLGRNVALHTSIDQSLIGGAVIRAGDLVIDGSVRARLEKLAASLVR